VIVMELWSLARMPAASDGSEALSSRLYSWTVRESPGTLIADQSTDSFSTEGSVASKTAYIAEAAYTFEMTDMYGEGIFYRYSAGEYKVTVNGEPGAVSTCGGFRDVVRESFDVGRSRGPPLTTGFRV
jgi:hypothetical protein